MSKTEARAKSADKPNGALFPTFEIGPFAEMHSRGLAASTRAGEALAKGVATYNQHLIGFLGRRFKADMDAARVFSACRTGEETAQAHADFMETMMADYFNEMHALLSVGAEIAKGVVEPLEQGAAETMHSADARSAA